MVIYIRPHDRDVKVWEDDNLISNWFSEEATDD